MIVKNEAAVIERCLRSVRPFIDEWVIVDTGSDDGTPEIVRRALADVKGELIARPWVDFAHNRTEALAQARGRCDYTLVIDADETLEAVDGFAMPDLTADAYDLEVRYDGISYRRRQLLRSTLPWRYHGVVHEYVDCDTPHRVRQLDGLHTIVRHDGARARDPLTYRRDALVLEQALLDEPDNARYVFYLGQSYRDAGELESALRAYRRRAAMGGWRDEVWFSLYQVAVIEERLERPWSEVMESHLVAYAAAPDRAEPLFRIGVHYQAAGRHELANLFLAHACAIPVPGPDRLFVERDMYEYLLPVERAVAAHYLGDFVTAVGVNNQILASESLPASAVRQIQRNRRFSLDALHPPDPSPTPARIRVVALVDTPGSEIETAVDGVLRQEQTVHDVTVIAARSTGDLAQRLPSDPRVRVMAGMTLATFVADECHADDVVLALAPGTALASPETTRQIAASFADRGCMLLHAPHRQERVEERVQPPGEEAAFIASTEALGPETALCFRAELAQRGSPEEARELWRAAGFDGTRSLDEALTVTIDVPTSASMPQVSLRAPRDGVEDTSCVPDPAVSCLMITRDRMALARQAIRCFADQRYARRELIIVSEGNNRYRQALTRYANELEIENLRIVPADEGTSLGALRNMSVGAADGDIVCQWDDDDLSHPDRLATQLDGMLAAQTRACFLTDHLQYLVREQLAFWIDWTLGGRVTNELQLFPGTVMHYKDVGFMYPEVGPSSRRGEDSVLVAHLFRTEPVTRLPGMGHLYVYRYHGANTFDEAHHLRITSCRAPNAAIDLHEARIRDAFGYYPIPKPVTVVGAEGPALTIY